MIIDGSDVVARSRQNVEKERRGEEKRVSCSPFSWLAGCACLDEREPNSPLRKGELSRTQNTKAISMAKMNKPSSAHPRCIYKTSEFLGILLCAAAYFLHHSYPLAFSSQSLDLSQFTCIPSCRTIGYLLLVSSAALLKRTQAEMATYGQPHKPGKPTTSLITTGPFHYSRNPTYTTIILFLQPGLALVFDSVWLVILLPFSFCLFWYVMVKPEEEYLQEKFRRGREWSEYCKHTRRWL